MNTFVPSNGKPLFWVFIPDEVERLRIGIVEAVRSGALVDQTYRIWNDRRAAILLGSI